MERKELKRGRMDEISQKFADTELAFEYEMGVKYQENLMKRREEMLQKMNERKKEGDSSQ